MELINGTLSSEQMEILSNVYMAFLSPSLLGSVSVLLVSVFRWEDLRDQVVLLVQLAAADLLASIILMSTSVLNKVPTVHTVKICKYSLPLSLTFYFISFLLVVVYAWKSKNAIQGWREGGDGGEERRGTRRTLLVYVFVWLFPLLLYLLYVFTFSIKAAHLLPSNEEKNIIQEENYCTRCLLFLHVWKDSCSDEERIHDIFIRVFLFLVVVPVMASCSVIYYQVGRWYECRQQASLFPVERDGRSRKRCKRVFSTARSMVAVILLCWTPALVLIIVSTVSVLSDAPQSSFFILYLVQAASVSLQGFFNSFVYGWNRPNFSEAVLRENSSLLERCQQNLAYYDQSLEYTTTTQCTQ